MKKVEEVIIRRAKNGFIISSHGPFSLSERDIPLPVVVKNLRGAMKEAARLFGQDDEDEGTESKSPHADSPEDMY